MPVLPQSGEATSLAPLLPESYDVIWALVMAVIALLMFAAVVQIARARDLTSTARAVWIALVLSAPPLGAIAALLLVHRARPLSVARSS